jgi:preprotein translocase subunit SecF
VSFARGMRLFRGQEEFRLNIVGHRRWWFAISAALIAISIVGLFAPGLNLGIDFTGGALLEYPNRAGVGADQVKSELARVGHGDAVVQIIEGNQVSVRTGSLGEERADVLAALAEQAGIETDEISVEDVGPKWGQQISAKALQGLLIFLVLVSIYIAFRFEWKMAVAALAALFHDVVITAGVYALSGQEVTPETVIAILTILGYSLYDTVVIFDKVKENTESIALVSRETYAGAVNLSLNQVLMRSLNTSLVVLLPVGALMLFGGETLQSFAFALFVGLILGAYSSIFIASPVLAVLKEREPKLAEIRARARRREIRPVTTPAEAETEPAPLAATAAGSGGPARTATAARPTTVRRKPKKKPRSKRKRR